jgi:hypothetical protein
MKQSFADTPKDKKLRSDMLLDNWRLQYFWNFFSTKRYIIVSLILLTLMISHSFYGNWVADFWEHSAVVKEFSTNPLNPRHPMLKVDKPHPFFSPYLLFVGLFARFSSLSPVDALAIAGVFNLVLLLISLRLFINCLFYKNQDAIGFYSLIFILFLWPVKAWYWSGFIHFNVIGHVLPYPSTFSIATTFLILYLYYNALNSMYKAKLLVSGILTSLVILTHPTTGIFTLIGLFSITLQLFKNSGVKAIMSGIFLLIVVIFLVFLWPYYSFWELTKSSDAEFHRLSYCMYKKFFISSWPIILLSPFALDLFFSRQKNNKCDALMLMFCFATTIYLIGYFTGLYGVGRIISFIVIIIQIALGAQLAILESEVKLDKCYDTIPIIIVIVGLIAFNNNLNVLKRTFNGFKGLRYCYTNYIFLERYVEQYDVILSDLNTSWMIPTFGGKVIASLHPAHWIDDHMERRYKLNRFFSEELTLVEKMAIINLYGVSFILINKDKVKNVKSYFILGNFVYENKSFILINCFHSEHKIDDHAKKN